MTQKGYFSLDYGYCYIMLIADRHTVSLTRKVTQTNKQRLMIDLRPFIFVSISIPSLLILFTLSLFFIRCDPDLPPVMCRPYALTLCQDTDFISVNI